MDIETIVEQLGEGKFENKEPNGKTISDEMYYTTFLHNNRCYSLSKEDGSLREMIEPTFPLISGYRAKELLSEFEFDVLKLYTHVMGYVLDEKKRIQILKQNGFSDSEIAEAYPTIAKNIESIMAFNYNNFNFIFEFHSFYKNFDAEEKDIADRFLKENGTYFELVNEIMDMEGNRLASISNALDLYNSGLYEKIEDCF